MDLQPIGRIRSPHTQHSGTPIQPSFGDAADRAVVEIDAPWREALTDLEGYGRIWVLVWLDRAADWTPRVVPYRDTVKRGLFSTRAPSRPNPIGLSCVALHEVDVEAGRLTIGTCDLLDATPVLDVKPYIPAIDAFPDARAGWFGASKARREQADDRFA